MELNIFPWSNGKEKPFWVNPENGLEWYVDKSTTDWCTREMLNDNPILDATCFYVVEVDGEKRNPLTRILIDNKTNEPIAEETSLEAMTTKIDIFRVALLFDENEKL